MFRGTKDLSTAQLGTIATALGGDFNAETSDTLTQYEFTIPASDLDAVLRIESDRMRDVLDLQAEWENERGAIEQEVLRDETAPGADFFDAAQKYVFAGSPYAREGVGTVEAFNRLTGPELLAFHRKWYAPNNAVLVIAGNVDSAAVLAQVRHYFEDIPRREIPPHPAVHFQPLVRKTIVGPTTLTYALAAVAFRFPGVNSPDFLPAYVLQQVLEAQRGPLQPLVDSGEALDAEWNAEPYFPEGQLAIATAALEPSGDPVRMAQRLESILREYAEHGVPKELFETTKRQAIASQELSRNSISALASDWATTIALDKEPSIAREQQLIADVTLAQVDRAAKKYLDVNHVFVGALTPSAGASKNGPPAPAARGPERPLDVKSAVTALPAWGSALVDHVAVAPDTAPAPTRERLPNGITLIVRPARISDSVFVYGSVKNNPALQEPPGQEGVSAVLDSLFEFGSATRDRQAFQRAQDDIDTQIAGGTRFAMQTTSGAFARAVTLLSENELHPRLDEPTFETARRRALGQLETSLTGTGTAAEIGLAEKLLPPGDPGLRRPLPSTVAQLTLADERTYYSRIFRPDLTTIVVVGNVTPEAARAAIGEAFGAWTAQGAPPSLEMPDVPPNAPGDVRVDAPSLAQDNVRLAEVVQVDRTTPQYAAMQLGNAIFGGAALGAEQTRLFRDIRQSAGLVYSIESNFAPQRGRSEFSIEFASLPGNVDRIVSLIETEISRMQTEDAGDFELSLAKAAIVRRAGIDEASLASIGGALLGDAQGGFPLDQGRRDAAAILATPAKAVRDAFAAFVRKDGFVKVVLGP